MAKKKRAHGEGTYKKRKDGRWEAQYTTDTPSGTKRKSVYGSTRAEVAVKLRKVLADQDSGVCFDAENLTLGEYLNRWLEGSVKVSVWHTTYRDYAGHVRNHIAPELGRLKLAQLTPAHVQTLYRKKMNSGLSSRTVNYIHATLHKALEQAVRWRLVPYNVSDGATKPRQEKRETEALTIEQVFAFLRTAHEVGDRFEALYVVAAFTGMRPGELLALNWRDLLLDGPEPAARVQRGLSKGPGGPAFKRTKTEKGRLVTLLPLAVEALKRHRKRQAEDRLKYSGLWKDHDLVFPSQTGTPMSWENLVKRNFKPLLKEAGLPQTVRFYDLRHTFATWMLEQGENPKIVQEILGHSQITYTMDTYSHVTPNMQRQAFARLGQRLR